MFTSSQGAGSAPVHRPSVHLAGLVCLALLPAASLAQAPADPFPLPEDSQIRGVRLDRPRAGAAAIALQALARCEAAEDSDVNGVEVDSKACILARFPARDLMLRNLLRETREAGAGAGPGVVRFHIERLGDVMTQRLRRVQRPAMRSCALLLEAALRGRCDDMGRVEGMKEGMKTVEQRMSAMERGLLSPFLARLPPAGHRSSHRVVCGPFVVASSFRVEEAVVVLGAGRPRAILDMRCRKVRPPSSSSSLPAGGAPGLWPELRAQTEAAHALLQGLGCLDAGGGACQPVFAPLTFMQLDALNRGLLQGRPGRPSGAMAALQESVLASGQAREAWARGLALEACPDLHAVASDLACIGGPSRPARRPALPRRLSVGEAASARALRAMIEAPTRSLHPREAELRCENTIVKVVYARRDDGSSALLGLRCRLVR